MLHRKTRERYRRMSTAERLQLTLEMTRDAMPWLLRGTPHEVDRRFELLRRHTVVTLPFCADDFDRFVRPRSLDLEPVS